MQPRAFLLPLILSAAVVSGCDNATAVPVPVNETPALAVGINGSLTPPADSFYEWSADVSGGAPRYTYRWYRDGQLVSPVREYGGPTGTGDFVLRLVVTDDVGSTKFKQVVVDPLPVSTPN